MGKKYMYCVTSPLNAKNCALQEVGKSSEVGDGPGKPPIMPQSNMAELHPSEPRPPPGSADVPSIGFSQTHLHLLSASS